MKFVPRMLSMDLQVKTVHILPLAEHARKLVPRMLSIHEIVSSYAQRAYAIISEITQKYQIEMQILTKNNRKFE